MEIGKTVWAIAEGYIPQWSQASSPAMESHETLCILNAGQEAASIEIKIYYADREPAGPFHIEIDPERTIHLRLNELKDPEPIPPGKDFSCVIKSTVPIVVQHTRLDSRQEANALLSTMAYAQ